MRQLAALSLALALGAATAVGLASCGGGKDAELLPGATAAEISENLDTVKELASEGECAGAADAAEEVSAQVQALGGVDPELKQALERGAARLGEVVATCEEVTTEAFEPSTEDTEEEAPKVPPGQEKKEEKEREKEEKEAEKDLPPDTPATPGETTPGESPSTPPPSEGGGTGAPGGVSPAEPAPEGE